MKVKDLVPFIHEDDVVVRVSVDDYYYGSLIDAPEYVKEYEICSIGTTECGSIRIC